MTATLRRWARPRTAGLAVLCVLSVLALPFARVAWLTAFDATGLNEFLPRVVYANALPSATVALVPAAAARYLHDRATALTLWAVTVLLASGLATGRCATLPENVYC